jgi:pimeloyl-ACP methyl ester carboxylesterase
LERRREHSVRSEHIRIGSQTIYTEVVGRGSPLVLIHGLAGSTAWWARNIPALAQHHEVHVVDLVGFGKSAGGRFVLGEAANMLAAWMRRRGLRNAAIVGHSMGGHIAVDLAAAHPDLVNHLVLVDAALSVGGTPAQVDLARTLPYLPFAMLPVILPDAMRAGLPNLARATYQMLTTDMRPILARVRAKTLVVWGEFDPCVPLSVAHKLSRMLPCAEIVVVRGTGHVPMWERPEAFNQALLRFLGAGRVATTPHPAPGRAPAAAPR